MALADLSGVAIFAGSLVVPMSGLWHASLEFDVAQDISGPQTLNLAGVPWSCSVIRAIDWTGVRGVLLVAGAGGWRTTIPAKQYGGGGVSTQMVLADAALACGESPPVIDPSVPVSVGQSWDRASAPASNTLRLVLGDAWWADMTGVVQTKPRPATAIASPFTALHVDGAPGIYEIGTESPSDWQPGATFSGPTVSGTVNRVEHSIRQGLLRTTVMVS
jgi:hypothetical protein